MLNPVWPSASRGKLRRLSIFVQACLFALLMLEPICDAADEPASAKTTSFADFDARAMAGEPLTVVFSAARSLGARTQAIRKKRAIAR